MIAKRFEEIEYSDIEALLNNQVAEGKTIEYKKEIVTNASSDKDPFLGGVSAFANSTGGDFIIGVEAKDGIPTSLPGVNFISADTELLRLEQILQNGLEPRLPSLNIKNIQSPTGENFIIIRVKRSWIAPHRVKTNDKFYGRNSKGRYPMDVSELRTAFMLTEQISERIRSFKQERVKRIQNEEELPALLLSGGKIILHLLPLSAFTTSKFFDVGELNLKMQFSPISSNAYDKRINLDGIVVAKSIHEKIHSYTQVFWNGCIEAVYCLSMDTEKDKDYSSRYDEEQVIKSVSDYLAFYSELDMEFPIYLFLSLIDVKDYTFRIDNDFRRIPEIRYKTVRNQPIIDRNNIVIPEITINNHESSPAEMLYPAFKLVWHSVGFTNDFNYDENGKWIEDIRRR